MSPQSRKQFIKQITLSAAALALQQLQAFSKQYGYLFSSRSSDNVIYYEKNTAEYETLRKGFNKRIDKYPRIIALCKNTEGVVEALDYARLNSLKIAIKSGGHCMEGLSSVDDGIVINLSMLDNLEWRDQDTITVGPACTLKKIYETLIPRKKYLPGGSCQTVAIGGLALGGGYGLMSRNFGLTCDSLLEATVVMPDGRVINTNDDPELLWALKGGGNGNFGIITQLKFRLVKSPSTMQSYKFRNRNLDIGLAKVIFKEWFASAKDLPDSCFSAFIFNGKTTYILLTNTRPDDASAKAFIEHFKTRSTRFTQGRKLPLGQALKAYYGEANPTSFKNASAGLYKSFEEIEPIIEKVFSLVKKKPGMLYQVNTLGGKIQSASLEEKSSFAHRDCLFFSELQAYWTSESAARGFLDQFALVQQEFASAGVSSHYRNYPDIQFKEWPRAYYGKNLQRLLAVKKKYDPTNILNGQQVLTV